jgi:AcrR family transcriptional regulator
MNQMVQESGPRAKLLDAATTHLREHGLHDTSLRQLAAAIGTSHRMLIYHFGSFEGLLVAIVERAEDEERDRFRSLVGEGHLDRASLLRAMWRHLSDPELASQERLFFELYGQALLGRPGTEGFLERVVSTWLDESVRLARRQGVTAAVAKERTRLDLAVTRGLLLDLLTTGDRAGTTRAFERYVVATERLGAAGAT